MIPSSSSSLSPAGMPLTTEFKRECRTQRKAAVQYVNQVLIERRVGIPTRKGTLRPTDMLNPQTREYYPLLQLKNFHANSAERHDFYQRVYDAVQQPLELETAPSLLPPSSARPLEVEADPSTSSTPSSTTARPIRDHFGDLPKTSIMAVPGKRDTAERLLRMNRLPKTPLALREYCKEERSRFHNGSEDAPPVSVASDDQSPEAIMERSYARVIDGGHQATQSRYDQKYQTARDLLEEMVVHMMRTGSQDLSSFKPRIGLSFGAWARAVSIEIAPSTTTDWVHNDHHSHRAIKAAKEQSH